ncbi:hypothetical protein, partial [Fischerella thermalis]
IGWGEVSVVRFFYKCLKNAWCLSTVLRKVVIFLNAELFINTTTFAINVKAIANRTPFFASPDLTAGVTTNY